jgi:hypothetical protein
VFPVFFYELVQALILDLVQREGRPDVFSFLFRFIPEMKEAVNPLAFKGDVEVVLADVGLAFELRPRKLLFLCFQQDVSLIVGSTTLDDLYRPVVITPADTSCRFFLYDDSHSRFVFDIEHPHHFTTVASGLLGWCSSGRLMTHVQI